MNTFNWDEAWINTKNSTFDYDDCLVQEVSFGNENEFGTILGEQSLAELRDLILAKDVEINAIRSALSTTPESMWPDSATYNDWMKDWNALYTKYYKTRAIALNAIAAGGKGLVTDLSLQPDQSDWDAVISVLQPTRLSQTKGDLIDLHTRLNAVKAIPAYTVPQPQKSSDADMSVRAALAPFDPLADKNAAENWKRDLAIGIAATLIGSLVAISIYKKL